MNLVEGIKRIYVVLFALIAVTYLAEQWPNFPSVHLTAVGLHGVAVHNVPARAVEVGRGVEVGVQHEGRLVGLGRGGGRQRGQGAGGPQDRERNGQTVQGGSPN